MKHSQNNARRHTALILSLVGLLSWNLLPIGNSAHRAQAEEFVDKINNNAGNMLSQTERDHLVSDLGSGTKTRAEVLRAVAENPDLVSAEFNRAFVLMQYFGYLRRDPNAGPDADYAGYNFWLGKLNQFDGNYAEAEMVKAFLVSNEYRQRFAR